ncbi:hypothetical protein [Paenibacillus sp. PDC88]|uniref:hypothetical protein n=1 Tax=Paenibacillus TaxID=44249 RepID=UPI000897FACA|nr:hypothetical protein [Paenibacillus sp. PDC88]SDW93052.1 hypothetical protein SAMN05518848_103467 [Paenibacillus sp. PDC88]
MQKINCFSSMRVEYYNNWIEPKTDSKTLKFPAEILYAERLELLKTSTFEPQKFEESEDPETHMIVSYLMDTIDSLPGRPDLAFEKLWSAINYFLGFLNTQNSWSIRREHKLLDKVTNEFWCDLIDEEKQPDLALSFLKLMNLIPKQSGEYLVRRLFEDVTRSTIINQSADHQLNIQKRVKDALGNSLYNELSKKYLESKSRIKKNGELYGEKSANYLVGQLFCKILRGDIVTLSGKTYQLNIRQQIRLALNGYLYTYRNERFHGSVFSSTFRSSKANLNTYAHSFYMFHISYILLMVLVVKLLPVGVSFQDISKNLNNNFEKFNTIFESQIYK